MLEIHPPPIYGRHLSCGCCEDGHSICEKLASPVQLSTTLPFACKSYPGFVLFAANAQALRVVCLLLVYLQDCRHSAGAGPVCADIYRGQHGVIFLFCHHQTACDGPQRQLFSVTPVSKEIHEDGSGVCWCAEGKNARGNKTLGEDNRTSESNYLWK